MFNFTDDQLHKLESGIDVVLDPDQIIAYVASLRVSLTILAEEMLGTNSQQNSQIKKLYEDLELRIENIKAECEAGKTMIVPSTFPVDKPFFDDPQ